ncbi:ribonuclease R [Aerococcus urinaehominis]|uniref:ribonuclease R n=1 Tax=Aerococcus urinaehominis TaxID=128944 RepID=UPI00088DD868|nr:ribonuclease R [Aerococcus urinaehominis]SDM12702.1 ribonuclease R [Aerococcus urinaehominis]
MNKNQVKEKILTAISQHGQPATLQDYASELGYIASDDFAEFVKVVAELERQQKIVIADDGSLSLSHHQEVLVGDFHQNQKGFGFVSVGELANDIFIPRGKTGGAMNGDRVKVKIIREEQAWKDKSAEGKIIAIDQRHLTQVTGEYTPFTSDLQAETGFVGGVKLLNKGLEQVTAMVKDQGLKAVDGEIVVVSIDEYPTSDSPFKIAGPIIQKLGHKDEPGVDILAVLNMFDIPHEFPDQVLNEADQVADEISNQDLQGREDFRNQLVITIDGADAKDLDDAISLRKVGQKYELSVHIADVSYYVKEGSQLDAEAYERGTSVYLTDRVVPMLPQRLSNGICSLHPRVDRLTMSCVMLVNQQGQVEDYRIGPSVIESKYRLTYDTVNAILEDEDPVAIDENKAVVPMLREMGELHQILAQMRQRRGAIDFDTKEAEIIVDNEGHPLDILVRERGIGERLIESFMLCANETVARHFDQGHLPFMYRVHEQPDAKRMQSFLEFSSTFGLRLTGSSETIKPKQLQQALTKIDGEPYEQMVSTMLLRSMKQARYDTQALGHFGLAAEDYTHFTSPIRRYPDLIVHRLIRRYKEENSQLVKQSRLVADLPDIAEHSSNMERRAVDAERETDSLKKAEYMQDKIGMTFQGIISSVTSFGLFVELANTVEGLVHISTMKGDYFNYIDSQMTLIGERTGLRFSIGDVVTVKVVKADVDSREIDFNLVYSEDQENQLASQARTKTNKGKVKRKKHRNSQEANHDKKAKPGRQSAKRTHKKQGKRTKAEKNIDKQKRQNKKFVIRQSKNNRRKKK